MSNHTDFLTVPHILQGGLRILNIDQENYDLQEVAYFDVYPAASDPEIGGSWSNYPYFESGKFKVTSNTSHAVGKFPFHRLVLL